MTKLNYKMTTKTRKFLGILLIGFLSFWGCEEFFRRKIGGFAGSYPFAECWEINASEREIVEAMKELNKVNPNFQPPSPVEFITSRDTGYIWESYEMEQYLKKLKSDPLTKLPEPTYNNYYHDYWLHLNLYYPNSNEIVHAWTRPCSDTSVTTFAFISLNRFDKPTDGRLINQDFWYFQNKAQINKFKLTFVDKIQERLDENRKNGR